MSSTPTFRSPWWWRLGIGAILLALGAGLAWLDQRGEDTLNPAPTDPAGEPDYFVEDARMTRFDQQGIAYQRLDTPRLVHTPVDDVIRAETPQGYLIDGQQRRWQISGDSARLGHDGDNLTLEGNARLLQPEEAWEMTTETLHYDNQEAHAWSDTPSMLRQHNQTMSGQRFDAWIDEDRMRLSGNVQGRLPQQFEDQGS